MPQPIKLSRMHSAAEYAFRTVSSGRGPKQTRGPRLRPGDFAGYTVDGYVARLGSRTRSVLGLVVRVTRSRVYVRYGMVARLPHDGTVTIGSFVGWDGRRLTTMRHVYVGRAVGLDGDHAFVAVAVAA